MAATFNIEMITKRTEFRVSPGDKLALPCELQSTGDDEHRGASQVGVSIHIIIYLHRSRSMYLASMDRLAW